MADLLALCSRHAVMISAWQAHAALIALTGTGSLPAVRKGRGAKLVVACQVNNTGAWKLMYTCDEDYAQGILGKEAREGTWGR